MHGRLSNEPSRYQNSFPTPKNTTPLGYHTRKKQVKQPSLEKDRPRQERTKPGSLIIQGDVEVGASAAWASKHSSSNAQAAKSKLTIGSSAQD